MSRVNKKEIIPEINKHYWLISNNELLIGLFDGYKFAPCGFWEGGFKVSEVQIVKEIESPSECKKMKLYYGN